MLKFKYHCLQNTLSYQKPFEEELWHQLSEDKKFTGNFESQGFILDPANHWISFQVWEDYLQAFYKLPAEESDNFWTSQKLTYYRKHLPKQEEVIFTFTEADQVEKVNGKWVGAKHE